MSGTHKKKTPMTSKSLKRKNVSALAVVCKKRPVPDAMDDLVNPTAKTLTELFRCGLNPAAVVRASPALAQEYCRRSPQLFWDLIVHNGGELLCKVFGKPHSEASRKQIQTSNFLASHWLRVIDTAPELCVVYALHNRDHFMRFLRGLHKSLHPAVVKVIAKSHPQAVLRYCARKDAAAHEAENKAVQLMESVGALYRLSAEIPLCLWMSGRSWRYSSRILRITDKRTVYAVAPSYDCLKTTLKAPDQVIDSVGRHDGFAIVRSGKRVQCLSDMRWRMPPCLHQVAAWDAALREHLPDAIVSIIVSSLLYL